MSEEKKKLLEEELGQVSGGVLGYTQGQKRIPGVEEEEVLLRNNNPGLPGNPGGPAGLRDKPKRRP